MFLDVWIPSPKFFGRLMSGLYHNFMKWCECHMWLRAKLFLLLIVIFVGMEVCSNNIKNGKF